MHISKKSSTFAREFEKNEVFLMLAKAFARKSQRDFYACEVAHAQQSESKLSLRSLNRNIAREFEKRGRNIAAEFEKI